jgi:hypothetical protein
METRLSDDMKMYAVDSNDDQYFWCVVFGNGRHLPVPILMDGVAGLLQNSALKFVAKFMPVRFDNAINQYHNTAHALGVECEYGTWSRYEHAHPEYA